MASNLKYEVQAEIRNEMGKGASRRLRREDKVPGIVYGGGKDPVKLTILHKGIAKSLESESFYSHILTLKVGSESERVVLKALQRHPYKKRLLHVDFQRIKADEKLTMHVPIHFLGEDKAPGVKAGGLISHLMSDVEVSCLPDNLPEKLEMDISNLELNDTLHLSDIKLPEGVQLVALLQGSDQPVISIHMPRAEEEIPTEAPQASEVPATAQKGDEEKK